MYTHTPREQQTFFSELGESTIKRRGLLHWKKKAVQTFPVV